MSFYTILIENTAPEMKGHFLVVSGDNGVSMPTVSIGIENCGKDVENHVANAFSKKVGLVQIDEATNLGTQGADSYVICFTQVSKDKTPQGLVSMHAHDVLEKLGAGLPKNVQNYLSRFGQPAAQIS